MPRAAWSGTISLGLINLPAQLVPIAQAASAEELLKDLNDQYQAEREHSKTTDPPGLRRVRSARYFLSESHNQPLSRPEPHVVSVIKSIARDDVSAAAFTARYVIVPSKGSLHAFVLFMDALAKHHRTEIGVIEIHRQPRLCAITSADNALFLSTFLSPTEVKQDKVNAKRHFNPALRKLMEDFERIVKDGDLKQAG